MARRALSNVNLNLLVALDALLGTRSVSEAARRVSVTTSAMSHSLAALRELFGDLLLARVGGRMALTPYAESLREPLAQVLLHLLGAKSCLLEVRRGALAARPRYAHRVIAVMAANDASWPDVCAP